MTVKTTSLTAVLALGIGFGTAALAQTETTPAPVPPATTTAPTTEPVAPATTGGAPAPVPVPDAQSPEQTTAGDRPAAETTAPAPAPAAGPAADAAAQTGTTTAPVPAQTTGGGEPAATTQDNPDVARGDAQPEVSGTADPAASTLTNEPSQGQAGAATPQAAAPVVIPPSPAATAPAPGTAPAADAATPAAPDAPTTTVATPATDAPPSTTIPAGTEPATAPGAAPAPAAEAPATAGEAATDAATTGAAADASSADPNQGQPATAPGPDANEAAAAESGHTAGEAATPEASASHAAHQEITDIGFSFEGPLGKFDQFQLQRGLQVYTEVCAACHGLRYVAIRTLHDAGGPGLPEDQVRAYAATMDIDDPETGETRPRIPTDHFPHNTSAGAPDLSVMAKARAAFHGPQGTGINQFVKGIGGPEYIYSILTHYTGKTKEEAGATFYENTAFPGGWIKMPPPLSADQVTYEDGHPATLQNEAQDVAAFLMWTAEPKMMQRKSVGLMAVIFLGILTGLLYFTNKRLWWPVKHPPHA